MLRPLQYKVKSLVNGSNEGACSTLGKGKNNYDFDDQDMINREVINGVEYFVLTAYFTKPRKTISRCHFNRHVYYHSQT